MVPTVPETTTLGANRPDWYDRPRRSPAGDVRPQAASRAGEPRVGVNRRTMAARVLLLAVAALALLLQAPAGAQDDPYGGTSTTTTEPSGVEASCQLDTNVASAGGQVTATVAGVPVGETVRLLFGGAEVGRATASRSDGQSAVTTVQIRFTVPDVDDGQYLVAAVGATFTAECSVQFTTGSAEVLGFTVERGAGSTGSSGRGSLARTGVAIALLLAVALALLIVGRAMLDSARQRRPHPAAPLVPGPHAGAPRSRRGPE